MNAEKDTMKTAEGERPRNRWRMGDGFRPVGQRRERFLRFNFWALHDHDCSPTSPRTATRPSVVEADVWTERIARPNSGVGDCGVGVVARGFVADPVVEGVGTDSGRDWSAAEFGVVQWVCGRSGVVR